MKNFKYIFPNTLTLINIFLGCSAIVMALIGENEYYAAWLIIAASIFDLLDGYMARILKAGSDFGKQLDSLADVISFGVAPAIILYRWMYLVLTKLSPLSTFELISASFGQQVVLISSFIFAGAAALRLARFNISPENKKHFLGLPTPAAAIFIASLWLILGNTESESIRSILLNIYTVYSVLIIISALMLIPVRMISLKFDGLDIKKNILRYILIIVGLVLIILLRLSSVFFILAFYIVLSVIIHFSCSSKEA